MSSYGSNRRVDIKFCEFAPKNLLLRKCQLEKDGINKLRVSCCQFFSRYFWVSAQKKKFWLFQPLKASLTGPNRLVYKRASVIIKTTVIEPQLVTAPPACFLLGPGIKTQRQCVWALSQLHTESKNWLSGFHGCSRIFFPTFLRLASPHILVLPFWIEVAFFPKKKKKSGRQFKKKKEH